MDSFVTNGLSFIVFKFMKRIAVKEGERYGRLIILKESIKKIRGRRTFTCLCECGNKKDVIGDNLRMGTTKSCGCLQRELLSNRRETHKMTKTAEYNTLSRMKQRCFNKKHQDYKNYGERGITVCNSWLKFENFLEDMGKKKKGETIDRINNDGNYCKENCRWTDWETQANNRRGNVILEFEGNKLTIAEWSRKTGINRKVLEMRIRAGWSIRKSLETRTRKYQIRKTN